MYFVLSADNTVARTATIDGYWIDNWIYWITHSYNYSVYTLRASQFTIVLAESSYNYNWLSQLSHNSCWVSSGPRTSCRPTGSYWPSTNSSVFWRLALCNSLDRTAGGLTASARLYSMAGPLLGHVCLPRARPPYCLRHVCHIVYVTLYCCLVAIATVVHKRHIAYSMHVTIR
jgi:hypothetical protein